jgi:predicted nucleic acid-binding protein
MIFVDTNVFVVALRYPRDRHFDVNARFLHALRESGDGVTSVVNVLETCGVLSFNLNPRQLRSLYAYFDRRFAVKILAGTGTQPIVAARAKDLLGYLERKLSFGDALVAYAVEAWAPEATAFVSWDARHFTDKIGPPALTPAEFLDQAGG